MMTDPVRSAALWSRLKSAGPCRRLGEELDALTYWIPPHWRPLLLRIRYWRQEYQLELNPTKRFALEREALVDLKQTAHRCAVPALLLEFMERLVRLHETWNRARESALTGSSIDGEQEDRDLDELDGWLRQYERQPQPDRMLAGWLRRLLISWRRERSGDVRTASGE